MSPRGSILLPALLLACAAPALAQKPQAKAPAVAREQVGNRTSENIPAIPPELVERLSRYQNTRGATFAGWSDDCLLISTRFAETAQAHRVCAPMGMREQLTFYPEPLAAIEAAPARSTLDGFVFGKDIAATSSGSCTGSTSNRAKPRCSPTARRVTRARCSRTTASSSRGAVPRATGRTPTCG